jgi:hypothetical protein
MVIDPVNCTNVCFTYTPNCLRDGPADPERLNKVSFKSNKARFKSNKVGFESNKVSLYQIK